MNATPVSCLATLSDERREDYWASLAFRYTAGLGFRTAKRLLVEYGSAAAAMKDIKGWAAKASISAKVIEAVLSNRWREQARKEWGNAGQVSCNIVLWADPEYPDLLREIPDPPLLLYYKGDCSLLKNPSIGVVGSRRCSKDGINTTKVLGKTLSASGVTTVSGLARGIDSVAHSSSLTGWGSTIAVLGTGISHVYPPENRELFFQIAEHGAIVTEFPPNMPPEGRNFPLRNRIISGLALGVLVVEAMPKSGSLITARHALEQGREVFAVPGRMQARASSGCHDLIRQGATAVFSCDDILVSIAPLLGVSLESFTRTTDSENATSAALPSENESKPENPYETELVESSYESNRADSIDAVEQITDDSLEHDAEEKALTLEERLAAIPEVIEIPLTASTETSYSCEAEQVSETKTHSDEAVDSKAAVPEPQVQVHADILPLDQKLIDPDAPLDEQILSLLTGEESVHIDVLSRLLNHPASTISTALLMLEVAGSVRQLPGMKYSKM